MTALFDGAFSGKTVLVTGHTGFKGSWLSLWLTELGAKVVGLALPPDTKPSLYEQLGLDRLMDSRIGDVRDEALVARVLGEARPAFVFHLAAQPLVRRSYDAPVETFAVNVLGLAHLLEAVRKTDSVRVCQIITTDKCYENREDERACSEEDRLGGRDPYSSSKACAELVVSSYRDSFFPPSKTGHGVSLSSTRAGNVIGGGDWATDRLLPDSARALLRGQKIVIRNQRSVRPWQFVLDPLSGYLRLASLQAKAPASYAEPWNFGPNPGSARTVGQVAGLVVRAWGSGAWTSAPADPSAPHEAGFLQLDSAKAARRLQWRPVYDLEQAVEETVAWYRASGERGFNALASTRRQINSYAQAATQAGLSWAAKPRREATRVG